MTKTNEVGTVKTSVYRSDGYTCVKYHDTEVVKFSHDKIILESGGWRTLTTKTRMNQASNQYDLGYLVYQSNFDWYVDYNGETWEFYDGMELERVRWLKTSNPRIVMGGKLTQYCRDVDLKEFWKEFVVGCDDDISWDDWQACFKPASYDEVKYANSDQVY